MVGGDKIEIPLKKDVVLIFLAAFSMAYALGSFGTVLPFAVLYLGGGDGHLGVCASMNFAVYLVGCLFIGGLLHKFRDRHTAIVGGCGMVLTFFLMFLTLLFSDRSDDVNWVGLIIFTGLAGLNGLAMSMWWPPVMGWMSSGPSGADLSRRLSTYNIFWTAGLAVSPFFAGMLSEVSPIWALLMSVVFGVAGWLFILSAGRGKADLREKVNSAWVNCANSGDGDGVNGVGYPAGLGRLLLASRFALVGSLVCVALLRTQVAVLFKKDLGLSESEFGFVTSALFIAYAVMFFTLSRTARWHYRLLPFLGVQLLVLVFCGMVIVGSLFEFGFWYFIFAALTLGVVKPFLFLSHQYYALCGARKRSVQMAIHEILLAAGFIIGALAGGFIAESFSRRVGPYLFAGVVMVMVMIVEGFILFGGKKGAQRGEATD
jgi:MFS family permease